MKVESWDPDLQSLITRYQNGTLDLQPAFQRGLVWNPEKKARLVDTLLRGWRIPPVHYLVEQDERLSILDGQQRLQALFDFIGDKWVLRSFPPVDDSLSILEGCRFSTMPPIWQRRLLDSRISGYRLYDYEVDEPYELFFRLNLPTGLTQAEKRNALVGRTREQVRRLVDTATSYGWGSDLLGFGDGRMAYDDVIARVCVYISANSLRVPLGPNEMERVYRDPEGFTDETLEIARAGLERVTYALKHSPVRIRMNKATLLTWLLVSARIARTEYARLEIDSALYELEAARAKMGRRDPGSALTGLDDPAWFGPLAALYTNRASLRVADVLSVQARDAVAWLCIARTNAGNPLPPQVTDMSDVLARAPFFGREGFEDSLLTLLASNPRWSGIR